MPLDGEFYKTVFSDFPEPLFIVDSDLRCVGQNKAFRRWCGNSLSDNAPITTIWPAAAELQKGVSEIRTRFVVKGCEEELGVIITELSCKCFLVQLLPESGLGGERHFHAQRLRTLGMLAGGVAHDFNNILAGILGHITFLKTILPEHGSHAESLSAIEEGAKKASLITQQILKFSKMETAETLKKIDINELIVKTYGLLRGALSPLIDLQYDLPQEPIYVMAVEGRLAQVLVNLVINARDALNKSGKIVISADVCNDLKALKGVQLDCTKEWVVMTVTDNGSGMSEDVIQHVFEPYFSTKKNKGTGLGLATVLSIVKSFGGVIKIRSKVGAGTVMSVYLPKVEVSGDVQTSKDSKRVQLVGGSEKILVVDDDAAVRSVLEMSLTHLGYEVEIVTTGYEAVEKLKEHKDKFDLVMLDMLMPQLSGNETFLMLRNIQPDLKVLAMSGYTSEESVKSILQNGGKGFIQKPFTIADLSKKVRVCLDGE